MAEELDVEVEYVLVTGYAAAVSLFRSGDLDMVWFGGLTDVQARLQVERAQVAVVGLVGAGGLGSLLALQLAAFDHRAVTATLLSLVALTFAVDIAGSVIRRSLR